EQQPSTSGDVLLLGLDDYIARTNGIDTELSRIPRGSISHDCLKVVIALSNAASLDKDASQQWADCVANDSFCHTTVLFCAVDKPDAGICPPGQTNLDDPFQLEMSIIEDTGAIMRSDWKRARATVKRAKGLLGAINRTSAPTSALPGSEGRVPSSVYGKAYA